MHDAPKRILYYSEGWGFGGIERFIMNTVAQLNPAQYRFDIFCTHDWSDAYDDTISCLGGRRYVVFKGHKPNLVKRLFASISVWKRLLRKNHYDVVHINIMNGVGFIYAHRARKAGIPVRIVHSHNTAFGSGHWHIKQAAHELGVKLYSDASTCNLACSEDAGYFLFGDKSFQVINNGVDVATFGFDQTIRHDVRNELGVNDRTIVFGSIGRISEAKNPLFQLQILNQLVGLDVDAKLVLIGEGDDADQVEEAMGRLHLRDHVFRLGSTSEPARYLDAMDVFTLPSKFEGYPMTLVEAVANGLPCLVSDSVNLGEGELPDTWFLPITSTSLWVSYLQQAAPKGQERHTGGQQIVKQLGYDSATMVRHLEKCYRA